MNAQELTVQVAKLWEKVERYEELAGVHRDHADQTLSDFKARLKALEDAHQTLGKSVAVLEAGSTLLWRLAPLALSALALVVSIVLFILKKSG